MLSTLQAKYTISNYLAVLLLLIIILYPPLVFYSFINDTVRITSFAVVFILLLAYQLSGSILIGSIRTIVSLWIILFIYTAGSIYANKFLGLRTALGYSMVLAVAVVFFSIIRSKKSKLFFTIILKLYSFFFIIVSVCTILNFVINLFTPAINFMTGYFSQFVYNYDASPFGLSIRKDIFGINVSRNFFFFIEPGYLAVFCLINIFVIGKKLPKYSKVFTNLNIISGTLTASFLFFAGYVVIKILEMRPFFKIVSISFVALFLLFNQSIGSNLLSSSSYADRFLRIQIGWDILQQFDFMRFCFGAGYLFDFGVNMGISSGLFSSFIEGGAVGMILPFIMGMIFCRGNVKMITIFIMSLLVLESYKLPLLWIAVILAGQAAKKGSVVFNEIIPGDAIV